MASVDRNGQAVSVGSEMMLVGTVKDIDAAGNVLLQLAGGKHALRCSISDIADPDDYLLSSVAASTYQPLDADLTAIAALTTTSFGRSLLTQTDTLTLLKALGVGYDERFAPRWTDFDNASAVACGFSVSTSGAGAAVNQAWWAIDSTSNAIGAMYVAGGTSGTGFASMHTWNNVVLVNTGTQLRIRARLCFQNLATASDDFRFEIGFSNGLSTGTGADRIVFRYDRNAYGDHNLRSVTRKDGTETVKDTGFTVAAGTANCFVIDILVAADGSQVTFDVNASGGLTTHTTAAAENIPTNAVGDRMGYGMYVQQLAYSSVDPQIAADWWLFDPSRTASR